MKLDVIDHDFTMGIRQIEFSLFEWIRLKLGQAVFVFHAKKNNWTRENPWYVTKCNIHEQYFLDYPHSHKELLRCPLCNNSPITEPQLVESKLLEDQLVEMPTVQ